MVRKLVKHLALNKMDKKFFRFLMTVLIYTLCSYSHNLFVQPNFSLIDITSVVPPMLGIMWGLPAAIGSTVGALLEEYEDWFIVPQLFHEKGFASGFWESILLFCNCGLWAFISAYMPWRLGFSLFVSKKDSLFTLRIGTILKFVYLMILTYITQSLFLAMTTDEMDMLRLLEGLSINLGASGEYALTLFLNVDPAIFFGLIIFFLLISYDYPFEKPKEIKKVNPNIQLAFDVTYMVAVFLAIILCHPEMIGHDGLRLFVGFLLFMYMFRPLTPLPKENIEQKKILQPEDIIISRKIASIFYIFFVILFLFLDLSGIIYGLDEMNTWRQFNAECLTMINISLIALICMLLRYHNSVMTNIVMLEVLTVFISSIALGGIGMLIVDRMTNDSVENSIEEMSIICRERLERTFNNIQVSVNDIHDFALSELESYEILTTNEQWRQEYLRKTERLFKVIASNTEGSVAFYLRLPP